MPLIQLKRSLIGVSMCTYVSYPPPALTGVRIFSPVDFSISKYVLQIRINKSI